MKPTPHHQKNAKFFDAIAHRRRQMLCELLLDQGLDGMYFDQLGRQAELAPASLSFHLSQMDRGGLIIREAKASRTVIRFNHAHLQKTLYTYAVSCVNRACP